jgi:tryptophan synthase alpha chain
MSINRLDERIQTLGKRKALVAFITAGYPDPGTTVEMVPLLAANGADIIELGVPFSDPVADGPTIQYSSEQALKKGAYLPSILEMVRAIRKKTEVPILLMSYINPLYRYGFKNIFDDARKAGVDGFIIPDLIPDESGEIREYCEKNGLSLVLLAAPNTRSERLAMIDRQSNSFVYIVSLTGVTGGRKKLPSTLKRFLAETKRKIKKNKRFLGFGISGPEQIRAVRKDVDGVIVGSAFIELLRRPVSRNIRSRNVVDFTRALRCALDEKR